MKKTTCRNCNYFKNKLACNYESDCERSNKNGDELEVLELSDANSPAYGSKRVEVYEPVAIAKPSKKIKVELEEDLKIDSFESLVVTIGELKFIKEDVYPWIDLYISDNSDVGYEFVEQIDDDATSSIVDLEGLRVFAINWYFNNVEVVERIEI